VSYFIYYVYKFIYLPATSDDVFHQAVIPILGEIADAKAGDRTKVWLWATGMLVLHICKEEDDPLEFTTLMANPYSQLKPEKFVNNKRRFDAGHAAVESQGPDAPTSALPTNSFKRMLENKKRRYKDKIAYFQELFALLLKIPIPEVEVFT